VQTKSDIGGHRFGAYAESIGIGPVLLSQETTVKWADTYEKAPHQIYPAPSYASFLPGAGHSGGNLIRAGQAGRRL